MTPIPTRTLGDLSTSAVGCGAMVLSPCMYGEVDDERAVRALHAALDAGATFADTSDGYGTGGHNERLVGRALREHGGDSVTVATKFGFRIPDGAPAHRFAVNYAFGALAVNADPAHVRRYAEQSLRTLGVEVIDLYYPDRASRWPGACETAHQGPEAWPEPAADRRLRGDDRRVGRSRGRVHEAGRRGARHLADGVVPLRRRQGGAGGPDGGRRRGPGARPGAGCGVAPRPAATGLRPARRAAAPSVGGAGPDRQATDHAQPDRVAGGRAGLPARDRSRAGGEAYVRRESTLTADLTATALRSDSTAYVVLTSYGRLLARLTAPERFPEIRAVIDAGVSEENDPPDAEFEFGLNRVLDGIEVLVCGRRG